MELLNAICGHRAIRCYKPECPPDHLLRQLIGAVAGAPSAANNQAWHFTVISRAELLDTISIRAKSWVLENEPWLAEGEIKPLLRDPEFHLLHHAPVLILIAAPARDKWTAEACTVAAQNLMLAATGLNLGSCWIGLAQDWLNSPEGRRLIGVPNEDHIIASIVVGYVAEKSDICARRLPVITWIRDNERAVENGCQAEQIPSPGLMGSLVIAPHE